VADRLAQKLPDYIVKDDLISSGVLGLIDAVDRFEPERGIMFKTYAEFRIKGAMIDELRQLDWVPRNVRKKASTLQQTAVVLEQKLLRPPNDEELADALNMDMAGYLKMLDEISTIPILEVDAFHADIQNDKPPPDLYSILADENNVDALDGMSEDESRKVLAAAIDALPEKERLVVSLYYHDELTMKEVGQVMGYTESRISQIHTKAVVRLRGKLADYYDKKFAK
jgi:RNA polymerase sigma factor for flagellar operon FliA